MSNEAAIDWFARNVHEWPSRDEVAHCWPPSGIGLPEYILLSKDQWLARRAELQNKPSWNDAPEWAEWVAQDGNGGWWFYRLKPTLADQVWRGVDRHFSKDGEVTSDWRDTLERRSEELKPLTSIEENQGQEMKQDNGWFERGELPPVGCLCLYVVSDRLSAEVEITAHAKFGLCFVLVGTSGESYVSKTAELHRFRPIRAERDVLIEIIASNLSGTTGQVADAIISAGFKLGGK